MEVNDHNTHLYYESVPRKAHYIIWYPLAGDLSKSPQTGLSCPHRKNASESGPFSSRPTNYLLIHGKKCDRLHFLPTNLIYRDEDFLQSVS